MPRVVHFEIPADDPERASQFYQGVFGWVIQKWEGPQPYWLITTGPDSEPGINGAITARSDMFIAGGINAYVCTVSVPSLDDALAGVTALGGAVLTEKMAIPGVGSFSYCRDTEGNLFGVMEPEMSAG